MNPRRPSSTERHARSQGAAPGYGALVELLQASDRELERGAGVGGVPKHKLQALDLFCGAGGASMGVHRAGFDVVGVDIAPQPRYPFEFRQGNALEADLSGFDFVWASPPCQAHSLLRFRTAKDYQCYIESTRRKLEAWGGPWIMENVAGAPLRNAAMLCGSAFGLGVRRHRLFESNVYLLTPGCIHLDQPEPLDVSGTGARRKGERMDGKGGNSRKPRNIEEARDAMGIGWMMRPELSQAIPPEYSEFLCKQIVAACFSSGPLGGGGRGVSVAPAAEKRHNDRTHLLAGNGTPKTP